MHTFASVKHTLVFLLCIATITTHLDPFLKGFSNTDVSAISVSFSGKFEDCALQILLTLIIHSYIFVMRICTPLALEAWVPPLQLLISVWPSFCPLNGRPHTVE